MFMPTQPYVSQKTPRPNDPYPCGREKNTKNVVENEMCQYRGIIIRQISSKVEVKSFTYRTISIQDGNYK